MNKAVFFDRDGIILQMVYDLENDLIRTVNNPTEIRFVPGIFTLLKHTSSLGYLNIIISNQPDIGLGKISVNNFNKIKNEIISTIKRERAMIDGEYYCFHHPYANSAEYKKDCDCRKPKSGLLMQAAKDYNIDLSKSMMIGDGVNDIIAGHTANCKTILLANLHESEYLRILEENLKGVQPDFIIKKLLEALNIITL